MPQILYNWIFHNTFMSPSVVDLGAGRFDKLRYVHPTVRRRIGIEIFKAWYDNPLCPDCKRILGDIRDFEKLLKAEDMDTALMIDIIEHFPMPEGKDLIRRIMGRFRRVLLMVPEGNHPQGMNYGNVFEAHLSTWWLEDVKELGFQEILFIADYHNEIGKDHGCMFAKWNRLIPVGSLSSRPQA